MKNYYKEKERAAADTKRNATVQQTQIPKTDSSACLLPLNLNELQKEQIQRFSFESKLNLKWSHEWVRLSHCRHQYAKHLKKLVYKFYWDSNELCYL